MKILIHCTRYAVCSGRYVYEALERLGHEVRHEGPDPPGGERRIWGLTLPERHVWRPQAPETKWVPRLAILMDTAYQWHYEPGYEQWAADYETPTVVWTVDNHVRDVTQEGIAHYFMAHFLPSITPLSGYQTHTWLPCTADTEFFTPSEIPFSQREYDVCCLGVMYPERVQAVEELRSAGLKVIAGTGAVFEDYRRIHHNSRTALVASEAGDLPVRLFEALAMNVMPLCVDVRDLDSEYWRGQQPKVGERTGHNDNIATYERLLEPIQNCHFKLPWNMQASPWSMVQTIIVGVKNWPDDFKIVYGAPGRESLSWENRCKRMFSTLKDEGIL